jgi:hypothetical protein
MPEVSGKGRFDSMNAVSGVNVPVMHRIFHRQAGFAADSQS